METPPFDYWTRGPLAFQWALTHAIAILRAAILDSGPALPALSSLLVAPFVSSYTPGGGVTTLKYMIPIYMCWGLNSSDPW